MDKCTGTVRGGGGGGGKDQITVTDRSSKIAHAMVLRQKNKKNRQMPRAAVASSGLFLRVFLLCLNLLCKK